MVASPWPVVWNLRPFSTDVTRALTCSSSAVIASFMARRGSSGAGDITSSMRFVEGFDTKLRRFEGEITVFGIFRNFSIGQAPQGAIALAHDRPEFLEAGASERGILHIQEVSAPETLARHRAVGLRIDGEKDAGRIGRLRQALGQNQNVPERIGIDGTRAQRLLRQRHRIIIGVVIG